MPSDLEFTGERLAGMPITVVVPVYNAAGDARRCVESVLACTSGDYRLLLIDDASPEPSVRALFAELDGRELPQLELLANERNLGFTGTANRGFAHALGDVVLLNSDTVVTSGWLDALVRCAASDSCIGTVTPFSNNAEICSFPRFCENNVWPEGADPEPVCAALVRAAVPTYPDLPTGVGFCLLVRRALLDAIGPFDPAFGAGYGEENDLCMRAAAAGFRNVLCDDAFVLHVGGRSFQGRKETLGVRNMALLLERHPDYLEQVRGYVAADPLAPLREAALTELVRTTGPNRGVLHVIHHHGGGTERHVRALVAVSRERWRHYLAIAVGDRWQVEDHRPAGDVACATFERAEGERWPEFLSSLCATFGIDLVHVHNLSACRVGMLEALAEARIPYGYTVHDLNFACPTITFLDSTGRYCGGQTDIATCSRCLAAQPEFQRIDISTWRRRHRAFLEGAAFLIAPSQWTAQTLQRYFPVCQAAVIAHGTPEPVAHGNGDGSLGVALPDDEVASVAVLGAIGPDKGARRLERLVELARERDAPVRFVLIGYLDRQLTIWQSDDARFTVHGRYEPDELPDLLAHYRVRLVLFPSACPETFSYTLSEAWRAGRPALVPPIGALADRVADTGAGWVMTDAQWRDEREMLERIVELLARGQQAAFGEGERRARLAPQPTLQAMADATIALYDTVPTRAQPEGVRISAVRVRDAFGYRPWQPPPPADPGADTADASSSMLATSVARAALRVRHTALGRVAYRLVPARMIQALRGRLR